MYVSQTVSDLKISNWTPEIVLSLLDTAIAFGFDDSDGQGSRQAGRKDRTPLSVQLIRGIDTRQSQIKNFSMGNLPI